MNQDRFDKTARIPVRVRDGQIEFLYDNQMPPLRDGMIGELVISVEAITDARWRDFFVGENLIEIAPAETPIVFSVATDKGAMALRRHLLNAQTEWDILGATPIGEISPDDLPAFGTGVGVLGWLKSPLFLLLRGESPSQLRGGAPWIPALQKLGKTCEAPTLNQALVLVSETFENERASNVGDAFRSIWILRDEMWEKLEDIRSQIQGEQEAERWRQIGLDPQKVRDHIHGGLFRQNSTEFDR